MHRYALGVTLPRDLGISKQIRIRSVGFKSDQVKVCESSEGFAHPRPSASFKKTRSEGPATR